MKRPVLKPILLAGVCAAMLLVRLRDGFVRVGVTRSLRVALLKSLARFLESFGRTGH